MRRDAMQVLVHLLIPGQTETLVFRFVWQPHIYMIIIQVLVVARFEILPLVTTLVQVIVKKIQILGAGFHLAMEHLLCENGNVVVIGVLQIINRQQIMQDLSQVATIMLFN
jgi:hypothetical protein